MPQVLKKRNVVPLPTPTPSPADATANAMALRLSAYIESHGGVFLLPTCGEPILQIDGYSIAINYDRDNMPLCRLFRDALGIGTLTQQAKLLIQDLRLKATTEGNHLITRPFAFHTRDTVYVPAGDGICAINAHSTRTYSRAQLHKLGVWVDHPNNRPMPLSSIHSCGDGEETRNSLMLFRDLLVDSQSCREASHKWLVGIHNGILPFLASELKAKKILVHLGPSGSGKTTGAQRFSTLLGLGNLKGDWSPAAMANYSGGGIIFRDNVEHRNLTPAFVDLLVFAATGGDHGRVDRNSFEVRVRAFHPVITLTSIEGLMIDEVLRRSIEIEYVRPDQYRSPSAIENAIEEHRAYLLAGIVRVIQRYLQLIESDDERWSLPRFMADFSDYGMMLCRTLAAIGDLMHLPPMWAADIIRDWDKTIVTRGREDCDVVEHLVRSAHQQGYLPVATAFETERGSGTLIVTEPSSLLTAIHRVRGADPGSLPRSPTGLLRRLRSVAETATSIQVVDSTTHPGIGVLNSNGRRKVGVFLISKCHKSLPPTIASAGPLMRQISPKLRAEHKYLKPADNCFYLWDYIAKSQQGTFSDTQANNLIWDLKDVVDSARKIAAIRTTAEILSLALPEEWRDATYVPMPGSKPAGHSHFDDRLLRILNLITPPILIADVLAQTIPLESREKGLLPSARADAMELRLEAATAIKSKTIIIVDDVLASGAHYVAARMLLKRLRRKVIGLFLARSVH